MKALTTSLVAVLYAVISVNAMAADYEETVPVPAEANLAEPEAIFNTSGTLTAEAEPLSDAYCDACSSCCDGRAIAPHWVTWHNWSIGVFTAC
jgi:hypothetical protein